ncbi:hypothetical protein ElyMa_000956300 [Elysia marginata]|uniref:Uncharacterized protein n=1 Tax=Elysia marginata TaxID=1093978 RepID=A0AAV4HEV7_9GAST|nr:hypothetical protein ElyMa_000956300 [Elysia marginata]
MSVRPVFDTRGLGPFLESLTVDCQEKADGFICERNPESYPLGSTHGTNTADPIGFATRSDVTRQVKQP